VVTAIDTATGADAAQARFLGLLASPEGVRSMAEADPDVGIVTPALDRLLNKTGYIFAGARRRRRPAAQYDGALRGAGRRAREKKTPARRIGGARSRSKR
jgi:hypothetical protein